jgi:hypothetical protein
MGQHRPAPVTLLVALFCTTLWVLTCLGGVDRPQRTANKPGVWPYMPRLLKRGTEESNLEQGFWRPLCKPQYLAQPGQKASPQLHFSLHFSGAGEHRLGYSGNHQCRTRVPAEPDACLSAAKQIGRYTHEAARADAKPATVSTPSSNRASFKP